MNFCSPLTLGVYLKSREVARGDFKALYATNVGQLEETGITADEVVSILMCTNPNTAEPCHWISVPFRKASVAILNIPIIGTNNRNINQVITFGLEGFSKEIKARFQELLLGDFVFIAVTHDGTARMVGRKCGASMTRDNFPTSLVVDDSVARSLK